jgi:phage shock protein PspC (stress-responsive transcriptional regulator)
MTASVPPPRGIRRSRTDGMLGGVCAGIAHSAGLDPTLLRIAVVAVTLLTGGAGLLAYFAAWVLIPREVAIPDAGPRPVPPGADSPGPSLPRTAATELDATPTADARTAWASVGSDLRSLASELRRPPAGTVPTAAGTGTTGPTDVPVGAQTPKRSPLTAADDAATALGERLRAPEVQAGARRAAESVSQAVSASVDEVGRRVRRNRG